MITHIIYLSICLILPILTVYALKTDDFICYFITLIKIELTHWAKV